jgi:glycerophosphoryl diester phosphodiesterase
MKPLYLEVRLYDPITKKEFPVIDGVEVEIVNMRIDPWNLSAKYSDVLKLTPNTKAKVFQIDVSSYRMTPKHHICVKFSKLNFSMPLEKLLAANEIGPDSLPIYYPSRLPYWDTGWGVDYRTNSYFSLKSLEKHKTIEHPLTLRVPIRRLYCVGHRGAPYQYPENTIASFKKALEMGANGLELDLCLTKDNKIVIFHDPTPMDLMSLNRTNFENFPFNLVSPEIETRENKVYAVTKRYRDNQYVKVKEEPLNDLHEYDIVNLTLDQVKESYRYHCDSQGVEYPIPDFEEFLTFASEESHEETGRLQFLYLDIKNPGWDEDKDKERFVGFGYTIGRALKKFTALPAKLVIGYTQSSVLQHLKDGIEGVGETRCEFAYDACGSAATWVESLPKGLLSHLLTLLVPASGWFVKRFLVWSLVLLLKCFGWCLERFKILGEYKNPLEVAGLMKNTAISIGCLGRPRNLEEIKQAICDRDYNSSTSLKSIIHYTLNNQAQMYQSLSIGVNAIVTDKSDEFMQLIKRLGLSIPCLTEEKDNALRRRER